MGYGPDCAGQSSDQSCGGTDLPSEWDIWGNESGLYRGSAGDGSHSGRGYVLQGGSGRNPSSMAFLGRGEPVLIYGGIGHRNAGVMHPDVSVWGKAMIRHVPEI